MSKRGIAAAAAKKYVLSPNNATANRTQSANTADTNSDSRDDKARKAKEDI